MDRERVKGNSFLSTDEVRSKADAIIAAMGDAVSIQDRQFRVLYQNQSHRNLTGDHTGEFCYAAYQKKDQVCDGCPVAMSFEDGRPHTAEKHVVRDDGTFHVEITASPLADATGTVIAGIEVVRNIADRWRAENALREERNFVNAVLDTVGSLVLVLDREGRIIRFNRACERLTGYTAEEVRGKYVWDLFILPEEIDGVRDVFRDLKAGMFPNAHVNYWRTRDGGRRLISWSNTALVEGTGAAVQYVIATGIDITEQRRMEEELLKSQRIESLGVLAGGIAHDYNNLLTAILGNINLARTCLRRDDREKAWDRLLEAERASARAKDLTRQLLTFSKGGAPIKKATSIEELIRESASFALRGSGTRCEFSIPEGLWSIEVDEGQISQVIHNLVINAEQSFSDQGGTIRVACENVQVAAQDGLPLNGGRYIRITVEDQGEGIPQDHLQKIFDPYFTTKKKGSGLGLTTCYSIVKKHDGHISVESVVGKGSKFHVHLPAFDGELKAANTEEEALVPGKGRVLVMDDEEAVRAVAAEMLRSLGYECTLSKNGDEAIHLYKHATESGMPFGAVIMDLTIPGGKGGKETVKALLAVDPGVKAVVSSGYSDDAVLSSFREHGFIDVIMKPYTLQELSRVLHAVLHEANA